MSKNIISILAVFIALFLLVGCENQKNLEKSKAEDNSKYSGERFNKHIRSTEARSPEDEKSGFKLPPGFEIKLYASEPDIGKPMNIAFDAKGRLWVTQSSEYPFAASPGEGSDHITILEDMDNDGKADHFTHFSDTLNIPIGILPVHKGAVAYSIPYVYGFTDEDDDGKADSKKNLIGSFEYDDTHGMVNNFIRGYDGWIHACHGYNQSTVSGTDGKPLSMTFGSTFRFRPDGSRVEETSDGRINPFGLVFDERGYLYSSDCHTSPLFQIIRGGEYPQWGKESAMGFAPEMKSLDKESTALAGLAYYADVHFPGEYQNNFYMGDVVASRVYRYSFEFEGSSPKGKMESDFVLSEDPWFRPVDVKLGPDGALYVADFYNRVIGHYEVPLDHPQRDKTRGRIWRITYKGEQNEPKDWTKASVEELIAALDADNMPIRMTATDQLVDRIGEPAIEPVKMLLNEKETSARAYIHGLWVLQRLNALTDDLIEQSANHTDPMVRLHTMRVLAEIEDGDQTFYPLISNALQDKDPHVQRAVVELLVNYPTVNSLESALSFRDEISDADNHMVYTTRLNLRNLLRNHQLFQQVISKEWEQKDAAYLADVMVGIPSAESATFMLNYISKYPLPANNQLNVFQHITRFIPEEQLDKVIDIAMQKKGNDNDIDVEFLIFKGIQQGIARRGGEENNQLVQWGRALAEDLLNEYPAENLLETPGGVLSRQQFAIELAGDYKMGRLESELRAFVEDSTNLDIKDPDWNTFLKIRAALDLKTSAMRSLLKIAPENNAALAGSILQDEATSIEFRKRVATILGDFPGPAVSKVLGSVKNAPSDLQAAIVMSLASTAEGRNIIFQQVRKGAILARTLVEPKVEERILLNISDRQQKEFEELTANLEPISKEKEALIYSRLMAFNDASKYISAKQQQALAEFGRAVFEQNCSTCHKIGNQGGTIGPNLDGVGAWGSNGLAEKILDPNRNISESFRTYTIELKDGKVMTGLYRREEGEVIVFADVTGKEFSVAKKDIAERIASKYTLMPDHFGKVLSQEEFNALLTYLLSLKS